VIQAVEEDLPKICSECKKRYKTDALFCPDDGLPLLLARELEIRGDRPDPYVGKEILGHILIQELAGVGAMGRVYRAFQKGIDRSVAVKILHRELSSNEQLVSRFNREAKVASRLAHANVVQVYLAGQLPGGELYIVMEYLDGLALSSVLSASGLDVAIPIERALHIAVQLCEAVGEAHVQGIIHRDLKPENVMLVSRATDPDFVKVLDFGIARMTWSEHSMATATGLIFGTARYISPEGAQGLHVTPASDVYGLAILFYQMLCGRTPFHAEQAVALLIQQIHEPAPPLRNTRGGQAVPLELAAAIMKNLAKDPDQRDPDARTFGRAIVEAARASGIAPESFLLSPLLREALSPRPSQVNRVANETQRLSPSPPLLVSSPSSPLGGTARLPPAPEMFANAKTELPKQADPSASEVTREKTELGTPYAIAGPAAKAFQESSIRGRARYDNHEAASHASHASQDSHDSAQPASKLRTGLVVLAFFALGGGLATAASFYANGRSQVEKQGPESKELPTLSQAKEVVPPVLTSAAVSSTAKIELAPLSQPSKPRVSVTTSPPGSVSAAKLQRATLDLSFAPRYPKAGQSVQFAATLIDPLLQKEHEADGIFSITGPGVSSRITGVSSGVMYTASLSLFEPGSYVVSFTITGAGKVHTQTRTVNVAPDVPPPLAAPSAPAVPSATGSVQWF
jgi:serine/threonine protein kinase